MKRYSGYLLPLVLLLSAFALLPAQTPKPKTYHTEQFDALNPDPGAPGRYSGLTGYVAPDGREYALLGGYTGTYVIDVTEKPIKLISKIDGPSSGWREIKTAGEYAYVVNETGRGLQIIDLSSLPIEARQVRFDSSVFYTGHTISQEGNYIYVHGSNVQAGANGGTLIFDISKNPTEPELVGKFTEHYVHDATIRNDTMYAAAIKDNGLSIVYLGADRKNPEIVTQIHYPRAGTHNSDLTTDGSYVMTTDEINGSLTLKIWDIRDRDNIYKVADFTPEPGSIVHNVRTLGRLAMVSWYSGGTRIIDISDPAQPAEVGHFDAYPGAFYNYVGNWDVYPYLPSGKILASYMESGLQVFTFDGASRGYVRGVVRDAVTGQPIPSVLIDVPDLGEPRRTGNDGSFSYAAGADGFGFSAYALNYAIKTGELSLGAGAGTEQDIFLDPIPLALRTVSVLDDATGLPLNNFSYQIMNRENGSGKKLNNPTTVPLPQDSSYTLYVGAWGYIPASMNVTPGAGSYEVRLKKGYADNAELDQGWTYIAPGDIPFDPTWKRGIPREVVYDIDDVKYLICPGSDHTPDPGTKAFLLGTILPSGELVVSPINGITTLTSPAMDLSGYSDPYINCALWYTDTAFGNPDDTLVLKVSNDNGKTWEILSMISETMEGWSEYHFRLKDVMTPGPQTRFRIVAYDTALFSVVMAGMDDFSVTEGNPASVREDASGTNGAIAALLPNPAPGTAQLAMTLPRAQRHARAELFDLLGRPVLLIHEGALPAGSSSHTVDGSGLAAGKYIWRLRLDDGSIVTGMATFMR